MLELEHKLELSHSDQMGARHLQQRLTGLDPEFKSYHLSIINLFENAQKIENEQATMDDNDDRVTGLFNHLACLATCTLENR